MIEGGADYFAYNVMGKYKWRDYEEWMEEILGEAKDEISRGKKKGIKVILKNYATESQIDEMKAKGFYAHFQYDGGSVLCEIQPVHEMVNLKADENLISAFV